MSNLRSNLLRIASDLPQGDPTRREILAALAGKTAGLPRATRRPPGPKFRQQMADWVGRDVQAKLEAGGVTQSTIDSVIHALTGNYGPFLATSYSGGFGSQNYTNFPTQQDAVDWVAGKTSLERAPGGFLGRKKYPDGLTAIIGKYGAGNDAIRDKAKGLFNKLTPQQRAFAMFAMGYDKGSFTYNLKEYSKELEDLIARASGETVSSVIPYLEWAAKVPKAPTSGVRY